MSINNNNASPVRLILISLSLAVGTMLFPALYIVFFPIFTGMYVAESVKMGIVKTMAFFLAVCLIIGVAFNINMGILLFTLIAPLILGFHYCISAEINVEVTIIATATLFFVSLIVTMYSQGMFSIGETSGEFLESLVEIQREILENSGASAATLATAKINVTTVYNLMIQLIPSVMVLSSLIIAYWSFLRAGDRLSLEGISIPVPPRFIYFKLPDMLFISMIVIAVLVFFLGDMLGNLKGVLVVNLIFLFATLFLIQGISILSYYSTKVGIPKIVKNIIVIIAIFTPGLQMILSLIGAVDNIVDLRKIKSV